jgi:hypothetical protein
MNSARNFFKILVASNDIKFEKTINIYFGVILEKFGIYKNIILNVILKFNSKYSRPQIPQAFMTKFYSFDIVGEVFYL